MNFSEYISENNISYCNMFLAYIAYSKIEYVYDSKSIFLIGLCNKDCGKPDYTIYSNILKKFKSFEYARIADDPDVIEILKIYLELCGFDMSKIDFIPIYDWSKYIQYNIFMKKFDCIIMNPPYDGNLHLKILSEAIKYLKDEKSKCINLSPSRWLQDPLANTKKNSDYNKFQKSIRSHLTNVEIINKITAQNLFPGTVMGADLGIYECGESGNFDCSTIIQPFLQKVFNKITSKIVFDTNKKDGIRVRFPIICNNGGSGSNRKIGMASFGKMLWFKDGKKENKPWHEWYMHNQYTKIQDTIPFSAKFNSEIEAENFCRQFNTKFVKVYTHLLKSDVHVTPDIVLWVNDCVNPRTKKLGYTSEWTDEDFYEFFEITEDEKKTIESIIEQYK